MISNTLSSSPAIASTLRLDYCHERSDYLDGDISGPNGATYIIYIESPDFSLSNQCATLAAGPGPEASENVVGPVKK